MVTEGVIVAFIGAGGMIATQLVLSKKQGDINDIKHDNQLRALKIEHDNQLDKIKTESANQIKIIKLEQKGQLDAILYRLDELETKQDKHNNLIERMTKAEQSLKSLHHRIDEKDERRNSNGNN